MAIILISNFNDAMMEDRNISDHIMGLYLKCTQCHRSSSWVDNLRKHLKEHSGDITNKCDHGGEKSKMCKLCGFIYIWTDAFKTPLKIIHVEKM